MYENYYGFSEKPFSLTPDPKYLYRSESHGAAFDLLHYAVRRRDGVLGVPATPGRRGPGGPRVPRGGKRRGTPGARLWV